jgi:hypothetical protein
VDLTDRDGIEVVVLLAPHLAPGDEVRRLEHGEVLHDTEPRELGDHRTQLTQRQPVLFHETIEEAPARGFGERSEHVVHPISKGDSGVTCQSWARDPRP